MQYDFLKDFTRRMKCVGLYALLYDNSSHKYIWKERGFNTLDEQLNVIFFCDALYYGAVTEGRKLYY